MKILHIISSLEIGGAQKLLTDILPLINTIQNNVELLVIENRENAFSSILKTNKIQIHSLNLKYNNPLSIIKIRSFLKHYDIIHVHLFPTLYFVAIASIGLKSNLIYTEHSTYNRRRYKKWLRNIEKFIYSKYKKIISISPTTQENLLLWLQENHNPKFIVINNGIDLEKFLPKNNFERKNTIIMVSRFSMQKDQDTVIKAMQYVNDDATLVFVGDGERVDICKLLVNKLNLQNRISFLGSRNDIPELLTKSYIGIQSSHWEGFGLTAVEIMASGIPIVASDVDGLRQVVEGAGVLFKNGDEKDLAKKINNLLSDKDYYDTIADKCLKRSKIYDIHHMANQYTKISKEILSK